MAWRGRRWLWAGLVLSGLLLVLGSSAARAAAAPAKPAPSKPTPAASSEFPWVLFKGSDSTLAGSDEDWQRASSLAKSPS
ncbi:MAG TPA: hypothetical protein PK413_16705, partial [Thermoanaerobaculia bacterium]|nr:hypothetical protein [Thermoanaerobaculia bacterium]